jgi:tetratricopeptide (TPR) repeat protein
MAKAIEDGIKFYNIKRFDMALQSLLGADKASFSGEEKTEYSYYLGLCYTKLERYNEALFHLEQVVTDTGYPKRVNQCRMTLAYIYMITKRTKMAEFELEQLIKTGVEAVQVFSMIAYSAWAHKEYDKSVEFYKKALKVDPKNATAMNGLGYVLVDAGKDLRAGLELCKKAVEIKPTSAAYLDSLGWAYYKSGDSTEARSYMRRALDLAPREVEIKKHMREIVGEAA